MILKKYKPTQKKRDDLIIFKEGERTVFRRFHSIIILNKFETEIWEMCTGKMTIEDISNLISNKYRVPLRDANAKITNFLNDLEKKDLINYEVYE